MAIGNKWHRAQHHLIRAYLEEKDVVAFLRWAGSKRKILPQLRLLVKASEATHYVEPFCGSARLFFDSDINSAVLGDINEWLIETYQQIKTNPQLVSERLSTIACSKQIYLKVRSINHTKFTPVNKAAYFIYLNRYCFNGIFRTNNAGLFNVPFAPLKTGKMPDSIILQKASSSLMNTDLVHGDFETITKNGLKPNSIVYLDPPYATSGRRIFNQYNAAPFSVKDIKRMEDLLNYIENQGSKFILSYADVPEINAIKKKWGSMTLQVGRNIAGASKKRRMDTELLVTNF